MPDGNRNHPFGVLLATLVLMQFGWICAATADDSTEQVPLTVRSEGSWRIVESANFRCRCQLPEDDARRLAECCEIWRSRLRKTWISHAPNVDWVPKCNVCVHPDQAAYNRTLNRPLDTSVGSTMMNFDQGRTVLRRVDVRADASDWSNAALPHELTHVVLGERFGGHALPRWADEGIAMLSESPEKHRERLVSLRDLIAHRNTLKLSDVVQMNRLPAAHQRDAFYGQSVALTSWLVNRSSPARFADFIEDSQQRGIGPALKQHYKLDDMVALQNQWDQWTRKSESIEFVSLQLQVGVAPIIASIEKRSERSSQLDR